MNSGLSGGLVAAFNLHRAELLRFLAARCGDAHEAEDLSQDLWIKLSSLVTGPIANPRAYLFQIANNAVLDRRRARQRAMARDHLWLEAEGTHAGLPEDRPDPAESAEERIAASQDAAILQKAIASLPDGARRALLLYRFEGQSQGDIARTLGISRSGVEKHLALAMKHLKNSLSDCGYFESVSSSRHKGTSSSGTNAGAEQ